MKSSDAGWPERLIVAYFTALPLLWAIGLVLPLSVLMIFGILLGAVRDARALSFAWPWFLVGACQLFASTANLVAHGEPIILVLRHALASYVLGWLMLGGCVAIGASGLLRPQRLLRAAARVGFYCVALAAVLYPLALAQGWQYLHVLTPIGQLLPVSMPSTSFYFGMLLYNWEELFGVLLPRLSLLFPWTTAMGFGGLCLVYVVANEPVAWRRRLGIAAGVFMVLSSMSRLAGLLLIVSALLRRWLALPRALQALTLAVGLSAGGGLGVVSTLVYGGPVAIVAALQDRFDDLRPSATRSRELVYEKTREGLAEAPLLGHGWPGDPVYPEDFPQVMAGGGTMVPGSHSTYFGLMYLGGGLTLAAFLFALARTSWLVLGIGGPPALRDNTLVLLMTLAITGLGEGLYSLVVPTLYAFLWLGVALRLGHARAADPLVVAAPIAARQPLPPLVPTA
ncbi:MAG: hypothetical protein SF182_29400 [Deltaproteobacteria bacterium]|nr:hypothetical protein [Deltaproteobacteria bacterium]